MYIYKNQILQSVGEYYESYFSKNDRYNEGEMIDGKLYVRKGDSVKVFFDLNPGIGVVELYSSTDSLNDVPFEALLPLCQWKLVPDAGKTEKDEEQMERRTYLRNLREIPFPANVPFTYTPVDHGIGFYAIELTIQPYSRDLYVSNTVIRGQHIPL